VAQVDARRLFQEAPRSFAIINVPQYQ